MLKRLLPAALVFTSLCAWTAFAGDGALLRIERRADRDRDALLNAGISVVRETTISLFAWGNPAEVVHRAEAHGYRASVLDVPASAGFYHLVALRSGADEAALGSAGRVLWREANLAVLKTPFPEGLPAWMTGGSAGSRSRWSL